jgi:hypothetical protein
MRKIIAGILIVIVINGCGELPQDNSSKSRPAVTDISLDEGQASEEFTLLKQVDVKLDLAHEGILAAGPMVVNLACDNIYGTATGDWTMNNINMTSGGTVSVIFHKICHITLMSYSDGTNTYTPVSSGLVITVSSTGGISTAGPVEYTSGGATPVFQWFSVVQKLLFSATINYAADAVSAITAPTMVNLTGQVVNLAVQSIPAPVISSLNVYIIPSVNSGSASATLTAAVTGATSCKYIDNSSGIWTPTLWAVVNIAFTSSNALPCPVFVDGANGFTVGNWTSRWTPGVKTLIIWANTFSNLSSYTTANIGP